MSTNGSVQYINSVKTICAQDVVQQPAVIKVYKRRFWMLFVFSVSSLLSGMLYPLHFAVANITVCYYGVSEGAVNWTGNMQLAVYAVLVFPVTFLMKKFGLRKTVLVASFFTTLACAVQFATLKPDSFAYVMCSTFLASLSNVFTLSIPPFLAAIWFPSGELSRACAVGISANQLGVALEFVFSPLIVSSDCLDKDRIYDGKLKAACSLTGINLFVFLLIVFTFQNEPKQPPSLSQSQKQSEPQDSYIRTVISMLKNVDFLVVLATCGLTIASFLAFSTLLNRIVLLFYTNKEMEIGYMGTLFIICGLIGSSVAGYILDRTRKYKQTSMGICFLSFLSCIGFNCLLPVNLLWLQFFAIAVFGFFLMSFIPVAFEYAIEMTYPESEVISASLLNASAMVLGVVLTEIMSHLLDGYGFIPSGVAICVTLGLCCILTKFLATNYKRSKANTESIDQVQSSSRNVLPQFPG